jgi:miniconductance mechanosensitive channel
MKQFDLTSLDWLLGWLTDQGLTEQGSRSLGIFMLVVGLALLSWLTSWLTRQLLIRGLSQLIKRSRNHWDDMLMEKRFFRRLAGVVPVLIWQLGAEQFLQAEGWLQEAVLRITGVSLVVVAMLTLYALLSAIESAIEQSHFYQDQPIGSYFQLGRIILAGIAIVLGLSIVLDKSPLFFLSTFGAMTAVLLLIFKDTILGFVASIQIAANDMVKIGDWVEMPKYGADGDVTRISLNTIKVRNFDKTITTIPTYAFSSDSFKNWRGMKQMGGRRIKRVIRIKLNSIRYCNPEMLARYRKIELVRDYLTAREAEIQAYNAERQVDKSVLANGRNLTNIGVFRAYAMAYLQAHPRVQKRPDMLTMVRHLEPGEHGLPVEIYCFTDDTRWPVYEQIQADIFDHLLAAVSLFDLEVFEYPTGSDLRQWLSQAHEQ